MSEPVKVDPLAQQAPVPDETTIAQFTPAQLELIQAQITAALQKQADLLNPPVKELTLIQKVQAFLARARAFEAGEKALPSSSGATHGAIIASVDHLVQVLVDKGIITKEELE